MKSQIKTISNLVLVTFLAICMGTFSSCKKQKGCTDPTSINYNPDAEEDDGSCEYDNSYPIPTEYSFSNIDYKGQTVRLLLLKDLITKIGTATSSSVTLAELNAIYNNSPDMYTSISSGKNLDGKVSDQATKDSIQVWFQQIEALSGTGTLERADGVDLKHMVEKTLMGSIFYYRALYDYLNNVTSKDNSTVTTGIGTAMEHAYDEAFGYFGAARDYNSYTDTQIKSPSQKDSNSDLVFDPKSEVCFYFAITAAKRDDGSKGFSTSSQTNYTGDIFNAWLKGRASITFKEYTKRDEAIATVKDTWEKIIASTVVHYINVVKSDINTSSTSKNMHWSELKGYFGMLKHNTGNKLGSNYTTIDGYIGSKPADASTVNLDAALNILQTAYGFTSEQIDGW